MKIAPKISAPNELANFVKVPPIGRGLNFVTDTMSCIPSVFFGFEDG